jgi:predicted pyridoxine 5'-phosphate oxidase superfamily flavin-nucleotide-binding protein
MKLTDDIVKGIDKSVLCWLATVSEDLIPNVLPKEIFTYFGEDNIIMAISPPLRQYETYIIM